MLCMVDTPTNNHHKRYYNEKNINLFNKHIWESSKAACHTKHETAINRYMIELDVEPSVQPKVRYMLHKHESPWTEKVGEITTTLHKIHFTEKPLH